MLLTLSLYLAYKGSISLLSQATLNPLHFLSLVRRAHLKGFVVGFDTEHAAFSIPIRNGLKQKEEVGRLIHHNSVKYCGHMFRHGAFHFLAHLHDTVLVQLDFPSFVFQVLADIVLNGRGLQHEPSLSPVAAHVSLFPHVTLQTRGVLKWRNIEREKVDVKTGNSPS